LLSLQVETTRIPFYVGSAAGLKQPVIVCRNDISKITIWSFQIPKKIWVNWGYEDSKEEEIQIKLDDLSKSLYATYDYGAISNDRGYSIKIRYIDQFNKEIFTESKVNVIACK